MKNLLFLFLFIAFHYFVSAQTIERKDAPFFQSSYINPQLIIEKEKGHYFIDFGKDAFGTLSFTFKSAQTDSLVVHLGEKLTAQHTVDKNPGGSIRYQKVVLQQIPLNKEYRVKLAHNKINENPPAISLPDSFGIVTPFRYIEIENLNVPLSDVLILQKVYNYRFNDNASYFMSSDTILNKVWDLCKHTIKATSFAGYYIDGDRERLPYEADALINQLSHYAVDSEYSLARRTNEYFINNPTWPTEWILHTALLFYYDYMYTGNSEPIAQHYEALKHKTLMSLAREDGLISISSPQLTDTLMKNIGFKNTKTRIRDIVDWPEKERDGYDMKNVNTVVNAFHYINLKLMSEMAGLLSKKDDSVLFYNKSVLLKNTINKKLFDQTTGIYVDGEGSTHSSLHANMFPLAFGLVTKENIPKVVSFIKSSGMACSVYGAQYLLEALYLHGEADYGLHLMNTTEGDRNWWNMIKVGSTMALEAWDIKYKPNLDWNHAWGTAPANIITRYVWGITPSKAGFAKVEIKPQLSNLTWSKIKVPTIKGAIHAEYKILDKHRKLFIIELPKNMTGAFIVTESVKNVTNNNKVIALRDGHLPLNPGLNRIEIKS